MTAFGLFCATSTILGILRRVGTLRARCCPSGDLLEVDTTLGGYRRALRRVRLVRVRLGLDIAPTALSLDGASPSKILLGAELWKTAWPPARLTFLFPVHFLR